MKTFWSSLVQTTKAAALLIGCPAVADTIAVGDSTYFGLVVEMRSDYFLFQPDCQGEVQQFPYVDGWMSIFTLDGTCAPPIPDEGRGDGPPPCEQVRNFPPNANNVFQVLDVGSDQITRGFGLEPSSELNYRLGEWLSRSSPYIGQTSRPIPLEVWVISKAAFLRECDLYSD